MTLENEKEEKATRKRKFNSCSRTPTLVRPRSQDLVSNGKDKAMPVTDYPDPLPQRTDSSTCSLLMLAFKAMCVLSGFLVHSAQRSGRKRFNRLKGDNDEPCNEQKDRVHKLELLVFVLHCKVHVHEQWTGIMDFAKA